jgi:hypothetical protein
MKSNFFSFAILLCLACGAFAQNHPAVFSNDPTQSAEIAFTENKGQVVDQYSNPRPDVLYGVMAGELAVHIKKNGVSYQLHRVDSYKDLGIRKKQKVVDRMTIYRVDLTWLNVNTNFTQTEDEALPGYSNYYLAGCPDGALYVKSFSGVTLKNLYKGIDLHYYEKSGELKHDYIVAAGADYRQIKLKVEGAEIVQTPDGSLLFRTPFGAIQEAAPVAYQNNRKVDARWKITGNILEFEITGYDPMSELIIDPVTRVWGSYYGGSYGDRGDGCSIDANGNVFMTGFTNSTNNSLIATSGSHQVTSGSTGDGYLVKMDASGVRQWGTYYGGSGLDVAYSCTNDASGNIYVTGYTGSQTGGAISTSGSHQPALGGDYDAYLVKFNTNGVRQWGTYYGGWGDEEGTSCAVDPSGNVYLCGFTTSDNGISIATPGVHQPTWGGGNFNYYDAFLVKFTSSGVRLWGTYYGGNYPDFGESCTTDLSGNVYMAGYAGTGGQTVIASPGSHQAYAGGGDAFLVKFNTSGIRLWGTYYGGSGQDYAQSCATDVVGNVFLAGRTAPSTINNISTQASHQISYGGGLTDAFLAKFNNNGVRLWGTFYGGPGDEEAFACRADALGNAYLTGTTSVNTGTILATANSHQPVYGGGDSDAFLSKFNATGVRQWGTFYGGNGDDEGLSCAADNNGNVYLSGETDSNGGISTSGGHQQSLVGFTDAFLVKFYACNAPAQPSPIAGGTLVCTPSGAKVFSIAAIGGATVYTWSLPSGWSGSSNTNSISASPGTTGVLSAAAGNSCGVSVQRTLQLAVYPKPVVTASTSSSLLCEGETATLTGGGAASYTYSPGGAGSAIQVTPVVTTIYTVTGVGANGCAGTTTLVQNVDACARLSDRNSEKGFKLYPNPTSGVINFETESPGSIVVMNALGQVVYSNSFNIGHHELNLMNLQEGIFLLNVTHGEYTRCVKMVKVR